MLYVFEASVISNFVACISSLLKQSIQYLMLFPSLVGLCQVVFQELMQNIPVDYHVSGHPILLIFNFVGDSSATSSELLLCLLSEMVSGIIVDF